MKDVSTPALAPRTRCVSFWRIPAVGASHRIARVAYAVGGISAVCDRRARPILIPQISPVDLPAASASACEQILAQGRGPTLGSSGLAQALLWVRVRRS